MKKIREPSATLGNTLVQMWPFARRHVKSIVLSLALIVLGTAIQLTLPLGIKQLFDNMLAQRDAARLHETAAVLLLIFVLRSVISFFSQYLLQATGDRITNELRVRLFQHYQHLPLAYHHTHRTGDFVARVYSDAPEIRNVVTNFSVTGLAGLCQFCGASAVMLYMNWRLGLVVLCLCPATSLVARLYGPLFTRLSRQIKAALSDAMAFAQESISGTHVVRIYSVADRDTGRFDNLMAQHLALTARGRRTDASYGAIVTLLTVLSTIVLFWVGGLQVLAGSMSAGALVAFFLYSQNVNQSITSLAQLFSSLSQSTGASARVFELLAELREDDGTPGCDVAPGPAVVEFRHVHFHYHDAIPILEDISFTAYPGEMIAILGDSGIGKSSLLGLLPRFYSPSSGQILLNGRDIRDYSLASLRNAISMVSQDVFLFSASVRENIHYGNLAATEEQVMAAARNANAHGFIMALKEGYDTQVGERGVQLSGGQRQRIAIARALLRDAPILILDEATSAVDNDADSVIHEALARLTANRTTLVVAHRSATIEKADRVVRLTAAGTARQPAAA